VEAGYAESQFNVAFMYYSSHGVPRDVVAAHNWLHIAGIRGHEKGYAIRDQLAKRMTQSQIDDALYLTCPWVGTHPLD